MDAARFTNLSLSLVIFSFYSTASIISEIIGTNINDNDICPMHPPIIIKDKFYGKWNIYDGP